MSKTEKKLFLRKLHRGVGLFMILFVIYLVVSGIMLNHTNSFKLESRYVSSIWLLDWYGIKSEEQTTQFHVKPEYITKIGDQLFLDNKAIGKADKELIGAVKTKQFIVAGLADKILLLTHKGELIETINGYQGLPSPIKKLAFKPGTGLMLATADGNFKFDVDQLKLSPVAIQQQWVEKSELPFALKQEIVLNHRQSSLTWERVMLDLHSGRLFGSWGVYVVDVLAILLLALSLTGLVMWMVGRKRNLADADI